MRESDTRYNAMKTCKEQASKEFITELSIVKQLDKIYSEILDKSIPIKSQKFVQVASCGLAVKSFRSCHYAMDALENGYYEVAMTLLRSVLENRLLMMYFDKFPAEAKEWLINDRKIDQKKIRDKLNLGVVEKDLYSVLSNDYAHPNKSNSIIPIIYDSDNQNEFHPYPYYNSNECRLAFGCWIKFVKDTITLLTRVFSVKELGDDRTWVKTVMQVLKTADDCANEIAADLKKI